jgi:hypothetical protein
MNKSRNAYQNDRLVTFKRAALGHAAIHRTIFGLPAPPRLRMFTIARVPPLTLADTVPIARPGICTDA